MLLAQSLDLLEIGKAIGSVGAPALLGLAVYVLWNKREADRAAHEVALKAAQAKLDEFQDTRIKEQAALIAALTASTGGK